jgi:hypothetical protein
MSSFNYAIDAVARSGGAAPQNTFATAVADNLPTAIRSASVNVVVATGVNVPIPASVFSAGSGVYALFCDAAGNNDLSAVGSVTITPAATIADSKGFFCNNVNTTLTVAQGPPVTVTQSQNILFMTGSLGAYIPTIFQNVSASITYAVSAIKIAN